MKYTFDKKFYKVSLALPIAGVLIFNVLPIVFMILIAFTNYGGDIVPPELVDWIGFGKIFVAFILLHKFYCLSEVVGGPHHFPFLFPFLFFLFPFSFSRSPLLLPGLFPPLSARNPARSSPSRPPGPLARSRPSSRRRPVLPRARPT